MPKLLDASTENRFFSIMQNSDPDNKEEDLIGALTVIILLISIENNCHLCIIIERWKVL